MVVSRRGQHPVPPPSSEPTEPVEVVHGDGVAVARGSVGTLAPDGRTVARQTAAMTALTAVSRLTGFVRVLVVAAVLGTTFLGNTYQSANTVPNILFELIAAGVLQAVMIPNLVDLLDRSERDEAEHVAGSVLGLAGVVLAGLAAVGIVIAPLLMRILVAGVDDPAIRDEQVRLGTIFLWFFLPQVVLYAAGMVATGVLNAHNRFALPVFAPVVNNVVVIASYVLFWHLRDGAAPSLDLSGLETLVLAGGTTLGVLAFCAVPVIGVWRLGFRLRPHFDRHHPRVRRIARLGAWAALFLAMTQLLLVTVLLLANGVEGGVVAYQVGFTFFLLPHALFALPVLTALFPPLARRAQAADWDGFGQSVESGLRAIAFFVLPAAAGLMAAAPVLTRALLFGETSGDDADQIAAVIVGFAPGLLGYGAFLFLARVMYATDDTRTPALVNVGVAVGGSALMAVAFAAADGDLRVPAVAAAHSVAYLLGAFVLYGLVRRRLPRRSRTGVLRPIAISALVAAASGAVMWVLLASPPEGRARAFIELAIAGVIGLAVYVVGQAVIGGVRPAGVRALFADVPDE
jgi:putative peptidoglycan lipid II flippase